MADSDMTPDQIREIALDAFPDLEVRERINPNGWAFWSPHRGGGDTPKRIFRVLAKSSGSEIKWSISGSVTDQWKGSAESLVERIAREIDLNEKELPPLIDQPPKGLLEKPSTPRPIIFGEIEGIDEGHWFSGRKEMMHGSFHRNWAAGIDGNRDSGTAAIVLSGGYEDDEDNGDQIIYTGAGGNDPRTGKQIENQSWENRGNAGLLVSMDQGFPVRVIRGHQHKSEFSPKEGYRYAGLYSVIDAWEETGKSGFKICRFRLDYCGERSTRKSPENIALSYNKTAAKRREGVVLRIIRDTKISQNIKRLYSFKCQVCGTAIRTKIGLYAEGAHIKPLGNPHNGEDCTSNILCLCPNHHVMFDKGSFSIDDDFSLLGEVSGTLHVNSEHRINTNNFKYHRHSHGYD